MSLQNISRAIFSQQTLKQYIQLTSFLQQIPKSPSTNKVETTKKNAQNRAALQDPIGIPKSSPIQKLTVGYKEQNVRNITSKFQLIRRRSHRWIFPTINVVQEVWIGRSLNFKNPFLPNQSSNRKTDRRISRLGCQEHTLQISAWSEKVAPLDFAGSNCCQRKTVSRFSPSLTMRFSYSLPFYLACSPHHSTPENETLAAGAKPWADLRMGLHLEWPSPTNLPLTTMKEAPSNQPCYNKIGVSILGVSSSSYPTHSHRYEFWQVQASSTQAHLESNDTSPLCV